MNRPTFLSSAKAATWVAAGAIGATAVTGIAFAANNTPTPATGQGPQSTAPADPNATPPADPKGGPGGRGGPGRDGLFGHMGPNGPVLHADATVKDKDGKVVNLRLQTGTITNVSATSLTVKSSDDFVGEWTLTTDTEVRRDMKGSTVGDLAVGDTVVVHGEVTSGTATAKVVRAFTAAGLTAFEQKKAARDPNGGPQAQSGAGGMGRPDGMGRPGGMGGPHRGGPDGSPMGGPDGQGPAPAQTPSTNSSSNGA